MPDACLDSWKCRSKFVLLLDQMNHIITLISKVLTGSYMHGPSRSHTGILPPASMKPV